MRSPSRKASAAANGNGARFCSVLVRSLAANDICYRGEMSGIKALCEMLKTNGSVRELKCVAPCARLLTKR